MSKFNLKIETNFIKYCMGKGEWGITLVELGKEWGRVIETRYYSKLSIVASEEGGGIAGRQILQKIMASPLSVIKIVKYCGIRGGGGHCGAPKS